MADEQNPKETTPAKSDTSDTKAEAAEPKAADTEAADTKTTDTKAADTKPADAKAADTKAADTKPADAKAADTKAADKKPANAKAKSSSGAKSGGAAKKKEKPKKIEDLPFQEFITEHYLPAVDKSLKEKGLEDIDLTFEKRKLTVLGGQDGDECWHVTGHWLSGQRQFNIAFLDEDIKASKIFYLADGGGNPSTVEQFMGDERRVNLDLMVLYITQRLNGQKWLTRN
ncbi:MAG: DUF2996 domain-containing protein [Cyanobacteria bacterium P01_C01_bin.73]